MTTATIAKVNKALAKAGYEGVELVRGNGYCYFDGEMLGVWHTTSVYVPYVKCLSVEQWVKEYEIMKAHEESKERRFDNSKYSIIINKG